jgi:hypothetical protein
MLADAGIGMMTEMVREPMRQGTSVGVWLPIIRGHKEGLRWAGLRRMGQRVICGGLRLEACLSFI